MQTYRFDPDSREFLCAEQAALDPLESVAQGREVWLLPADSTFDAPPAVREGHAAVWDGKAWKETEDWRGSLYWLPGDTWQSAPRTMSRLGPLPEGAMLEAPAKPAETLAEEALARAKAERAEAVAAITVTVDGLIFDGDEAAQQRMSRAVLMAESPEESTEWVLHDHSVAVVTAAQLRRACRAAGKAQTALWTAPYK